MAKEAKDADRLLMSILAGLFIAFVSLLPACGWTFRSLPTFDSKGVATDGRRFVDLYLERDAHAIEASFDPDVRDRETRDDIADTLASLPKEPPQRIDFASYVVTIVSEEDDPDVATHYDLAYQLTYPRAWQLFEVAYVKRGGRFALQSADVHPLRESLATTNGFLRNLKGSSQVAMFLAAIAIAAFIIVTLIACFQNRAWGRKLLWLPFIALAVGRFSVNLTTGDFYTDGVALMPFGVGLAQGTPYSPWILSAGFPFGALYFWARYYSVKRKPDESVVQRAVREVSVTRYKK